MLIWTMTLLANTANWKQRTQRPRKTWMNYKPNWKNVNQSLFINQQPLLQGKLIIRKRQLHLSKKKLFNTIVIYPCILYVVLFAILSIPLPRKRLNLWL
jgi:hypothetical protein